MNATSVVPDHHLPEERFTDHDYATRAIHRLRVLESRWLLHDSRGLQAPTQSLHVPQSYYDAYNEQQQGTWKEREESCVPAPRGPLIWAIPRGRCLTTTTSVGAGVLEYMTRGQETPL